MGCIEYTEVTSILTGAEGCNEGKANASGKDDAEAKGMRGSEQLQTVQNKPEQVREEPGRASGEERRKSTGLELITGYKLCHHYSGSADNNRASIPQPAGLATQRQRESSGLQSSDAVRRFHTMPDSSDNPANYYNFKPRAVSGSGYQSIDGVRQFHHFAEGENKNTPLVTPQRALSESGFNGVSGIKQFHHMTEEELNQHPELKQKVCMKCKHILNSQPIRQSGVSDSQNRESDQITCHCDEPPSGDAAERKNHPIAIIDPTHNVQNKTAEEEKHSYYNMMEFSHYERVHPGMHGKP